MLLIKLSAEVGRNISRNFRNLIYYCLYFVVVVYYFFLGGGGGGGGGSTLKVIIVFKFQMDWIAREGAIVKFLCRLLLPLR